MADDALRVAHVIDRLGVGGAEVLLVESARWAAERGWIMSVVSLGDAPQSHVPDELARLGVTVHHVPSQRRRGLTDVRRLRQLRSTVRELAPDVVHTHLTYANTLTPVALAGTGIPIVATLHNTSGGARKGQAARDAVEAFSLRRLVRSRIAVGPSVAQAQTARLRREIITVSNPYPTADEVDASTVADVRAELAPGDGPLLVAVGRLTEQKAFADLIAAFAVVHERVPSARLAIVGRGHLEKELREQAQRSGLADQVTFAGPRPDVPALLRAADVVVSSSHWEGMPIVLLEALAAARPIVATAVGDVGYAVGAAAVLVPPRSPKQLAAAVVDLLADSGARAAMSASAAREAERHSPARWSQSLDSVYRSLAVSSGTNSLAVLTHGYFPRIGGIERQRSQVTPRLAASGLAVTVVTRAVRHAQRRETVQGVDIVRVPTIGGKAPGSANTRRIVWKLSRPVDYLLYTVCALATVVRRRPDLIHTHEFISTARVGLLAGRLLRRPVIVTSHRSGPLGDVHRHDGSRRGAKLLEQISTRAAMCISVSPQADEELAAIGIPPERRLVINNGVDTERYSPVAAAEKAELRGRLSIAEDALVFVFVGRLMPEKRVRLLLDVWPALRGTEPRAELIVVGGGDEEPALRAGAPSSVRFVGAVSDTADFLKASDVFVLPSSAEGLSNALLEAQACGLATVLTDVGAAREVVTDGVDGLVVPVDDAEALLAALTTVASDPALRDTLGRRARANAVERYSLESTVRGYLDAYRRVLDAGGR